MDILDKQKFIFGGLFLLANKLQVVGDQFLGKDNMTVRQWFLTVMILQFRSGPPTLSEVAELMDSSRQNVKQLALKLEEKGFLNIERDEYDARALRLRLTEKSYLFWEKREDVDNRFITELFKDLSDEEINLMYSGFKKLSEKMDKISNLLLEE
jgi:DNA-binding MarR family transcriptional regulator